MSYGYSVRLLPALIADIEGRSIADREVMVGFRDALRELGFDVIHGALSAPRLGLTVEYIEAGEVTDLVWARVYLDLARGSITLKVTCEGDGILLSHG